MKNFLFLISIFAFLNLNATSKNHESNIASTIDMVGSDTVELEVLIFELLTDEFPEETSWQLTDEAGTALFLSLIHI